MSEQRIQTIKIVWQGDEAKGKVVELTRAISNAEDTVKRLNEVMGDNAKVEVATTKTKAEKTQVLREEYKQANALIKSYDDLALQTAKVTMSADEFEQHSAVVKLGSKASEEQKEAVRELVTQLQAKRAASEAAIAEEKLQTEETKRASAAYESLTADLARQKAQLSMTSNEFELYTAQMKLGANATQAQRDAITQSVTALQAQRSALSSSGGVNGSLRDFRGVMQNAGWQLQDTIVQLQMGTNAFTVLSQQGSQFASAFGWGGAVVGALIAVAGVAGGTFFSSMMNAKDSTEELDAAQSLLNSTLTESKGIVTGVSQELENLYKIDAKLADLKLKTAAWAAEEALEGLKEKAKDTLNDTLALVTGMSYAIANSDKIIADSSTYNAKAMGDAFSYTKDKLEAKANALGVSQDQLVSLAAAYDDFIKSGNMKALNDQMELIVKSNSKLTPEFKTLATQVIETFIKMTTLKVKQEELNKIIKEGITTTGEHSAAVQTTAEKYAIMLKQVEMTDAQIAVDNYLREEGLKVGAAEKASTIDLINEYYRKEEAIKKAEEAEKERIRKLEERLKEEEKAIEKAAKAREKALEEVEKETGVNKKSDNPLIAEEQTHNDNLKLILDQRNAMWAGDYATKQRLDAAQEAEATRHKKALADAEIESWSNQLAITSSAVSFMSDYIDEMSDGGEAVIEAMAEMNDAQKAMFFIQRSIMAAEALVAGISMGSKLAEAAALYDWTGATSTAWLTAGTAIGAAQAGAIMGTTFAGFFDEGGTIPAGQSGIVSEYSDELVNGVLVKGPASVTGSADTARIMSDSSSTPSQSVNQTVVQHITVSGNGDQALISAMQTAAQKGASKAYAMVASDFQTGRGIRSTLKKSIGV